MRKVLQIGALILLMIAIGRIGWEFYCDYQAKNEFHDLSEEVGDLADHPDGMADIAKIMQNDDYAAWLKIPKTEINYPVMWTPENEEYYIHRNWKKEKSKAGTLFMAADCDPTQANTNYIIYGHNMRNGSMFGTLKKYKSSQYAKEHPIIQLTTATAAMKFNVIAAGSTTTVSGAWIYSLTAIPEDIAEYDRMIEKIKAFSNYEIGGTPQNGAPLIILSTCLSSSKNGRFVVIGAKLNE